MPENGAVHLIIICQFLLVVGFAFSALTLLVGCQEVPGCLGKEVVGWCLFVDCEKSISSDVYLCFYADCR